MCLLLFAYRHHPRYPLLLLANRDEFYHRPTAPAARWEGSGFVAGRDLEGGGTWAGAARGRVAAVTNIREPQVPTPTDPLSRGDIPRGFLQGGQSPSAYAEALTSPHYRGFNALLFQLGAADELVCAGNRHRPFAFEPGVHGISNGAPDAPWPKVRKGRSAVERLLQGLGDALDDGNFVRPGLVLLRDNATAAVDELPHTGISPALELALSPMFVQLDGSDFGAANDDPGGYGTRASTLIAVDGDGRTQLWEQNYEHGQPAGPLRHFDLGS